MLCFSLYNLKKGLYFISETDIVTNNNSTALRKFLFIRYVRLFRKENEEWNGISHPRYLEVSVIIFNNCYRMHIVRSLLWMSEKRIQKGFHKGEVANLSEVLLSGPQTLGNGLILLIGRRLQHLNGNVLPGQT